MSQLTGAYNLGPAGDDNSAAGSGPWTLTATPATFSYVEWWTDQIFTLSQLASLAATFDSTLGGSAGGSPRIKVGLDTGGVIATYLLIYLGNPPEIIDTPAELNTLSGVNLIGASTDGTIIYDTSAFAGGSPWTSYSAAVSLLGSLTVEDIDIVADNFAPYPSQRLTFTGFTGSITDALPFADSFGAATGEFAAMRTIAAQATKPLNSTWSIRQGGWVTANGIAAGTASIGPNIALVQGANDADVSVQATFNFTGQGSEYVGLVARAGGPWVASGDGTEYVGNYWRQGKTCSAAIWRLVGGVPTVLVNVAGFPLTTGVLRFDVIGGNLGLYLNGVLLVSAVDSKPLAAGTCGMRCYVGTQMSQFSAVAK